MKQQGPGQLSDLELLTLIIGSGTKDRPVDRLAIDLLTLLHSRPDVNLNQIASIRGIGKAKSCAIAAAIELGRRNGRKRKVAISSPEDIFSMVRSYANHPQELFLVVNLNTTHEVISINMVSMGTVNRALIHPREVFIKAIKEQATAIVVIHNHPAGSLRASPEDEKVTERLTKCGDLIGIPLLDHLIISGEGYYSFVENGLL